MKNWNNDDRCVDCWRWSWENWPASCWCCSDIDRLRMCCRSRCIHTEENPALEQHRNELLATTSQQCEKRQHWKRFTHVVNVGTGWVYTRTGWRYKLGCHADGHNNIEFQVHVWNRNWRHSRIRQTASRRNSRGDVEAWNSILLQDVWRWLLFGYIAKTRPQGVFSYRWL